MSTETKVVLGTIGASTLLSLLIIANLILFSA
ncbi:hypothetical protein [Haloarcula halophila]|jgi:hypothetical protein